MFCDGVCKKGKKTCGLLVEIVMKNDLTGEVRAHDKCAVKGMYESMIRQEQGQIRIQAAVESGRNENVKCLRSQDQTLAAGFLGLLKYAQERDEEAVEHCRMIEERKEKYIEAEIIEGEEDNGSV